MRYESKRFILFLFLCAFSDVQAGIDGDVLGNFVAVYLGKKQFGGFEADFLQVQFHKGHTRVGHA